MQRDTARELALVFGEQQAAIRRCVVSGQSCKFLIETLETEAEAERVGVLKEKFPDLRDLRGGFNLGERKTGRCVA
jgi:hypothetical protein